MYRFFVTEKQLNNSPVRITGEDYNHIRNVLRMRPGEEILLSDGKGKEYAGCISEYEAAAVCVTITDMYGEARELPAKITLFQGYPKKDKLEQIIQKAVELGVYEIVPVMMKRCVVKLSDDKAAKRIERFNSISLSAAKQSKRCVIPRVTEVMSFEVALSYARSLDYVIIPYECADGMLYSRDIIRNAAGRESIGVFIGPEGGFDVSEIDRLRDSGGNVISLGNRILRTETAGIATLSILMYALETAAAGASFD